MDNNVIRVGTLVMTYPGGHEVAVRFSLDTGPDSVYWATWSAPSFKRDANGGDVPCYAVRCTGTHKTFTEAVIAAIEEIQFSRPA